jgi:hypothetical protein
MPRGRYLVRDVVERQSKPVAAAGTVWFGMEFSSDLIACFRLQ